MAGGGKKGRGAGGSGAGGGPDRGEPAGGGAGFAWSGRFEQAPDAQFLALSRSLPFDRRLYRADCALSRAWASALARAGLLSEAEAGRLRDGLDRLADEIGRGEARFLPTDEDIHMAVERLLTERLGDLGARLHTGRSRNDQVATGFRLFTAGAVVLAGRGLVALAAALLEAAGRERGRLMPGYTHLQQAQPVAVSHYLLSFFWMLRRDFRRLADGLDRVLELPLGAGALAGGGFPVDRAFLARELGFRRASPNSMDAVSDRDFAVEVLAAWSLLMVHLSRLAEDLLIFGSREFGFVRIGEAYTTGSSMMPNKQNADSLELARGKSGRVIGDLQRLLVTLKGLPSTYDRDLQEDKEGFFDAADTVLGVLGVMRGVVESLRFQEEPIRRQMDSLLLATEVADYLTGKGLPFRQAHQAAGAVVRKLVREGRAFQDLSLAEWRSFSPLFGEDLAGWLDFRRAVERRRVYGGTGSEPLAAQAEEARAELAAMERFLRENERFAGYYVSA